MRQRLQCKSWYLLLWTVDTISRETRRDKRQKETLLNQILLKAATSTLWTWNGAKRRKFTGCRTGLWLFSRFTNTTNNICPVTVRTTIFQPHFDHMTAAMCWLRSRFTDMYQVITSTKLQVTQSYNSRQ